MFNSITMRYIIMSVFLFGSYFGKAQTSLNDYKYLVVPKKFEDFKKENQYQTGTLIKHLFTQKGFTTVWEDAMPDDLANSRCKGLYVTLKDKSSMFSTKTTVVLHDCNNQEIFASAEGKSKQKDYKKGYTEAITKAMASFDGLNYRYEGEPQTNEPITVSFKNDVKNLEEAENTSAEAKNLDKEVIVRDVTTEKQTYKSKVPKESKYKKDEKNNPQEEQVASGGKQNPESMEAVSEDIKKPKVEAVVSKVLTKEAENILYAQKLENGYQLVDSTPQIRLKIRSTSMPDYYLAEGDKGNGVVYGKSGKWFFEYYENDKLKIEELDIKF